MKTTLLLLPLVAIANPNLAFGFEPLGVPVCDESLTKCDEFLLCYKGCAKKTLKPVKIIRGDQVSWSTVYNSGMCNFRCKEQFAHDDESVGKLWQGWSEERRLRSQPPTPMWNPDLRIDTATYKAGDNGFNQRSVGDLDDDESVGRSCKDFPMADDC